MNDPISDIILNVIKKSAEPLETKEIQEQADKSIKNITRTKLFHRLNMLRGDGLIKGKFVGPGKGVWIWWKKEFFVDKKIGGEK